MADGIGELLESGVTTFHLIHHPVMDMGSRSLTGWAGGGEQGCRVQMGLGMGAWRGISVTTAWRLEEQGGEKSVD